MNGPLVIKVGGSTLGAADTTFDDIAELVRRGERLVLVHGGGAEASEWLRRMGVPTRFERGLRVTDAESLPIVVGALAGLVNKRIVTELTGRGVRAIGLSGADARVLQCRIADPSLGYVGEPVRVEAGVLEHLLAGGFVPVLAPIGVSSESARDVLVNVNADTVAGDVAGALRARAVYFLTDVDGVKGEDGQVLPELTPLECAALIERGVIAGGMIPKVRACLHAVERGVPARILNGAQPRAILEAESRGTRFSRPVR